MNWRGYLYRFRPWIDSRKFRCKVCGVQCITAPANSGFWRSTAICLDHCEDHDYEYERGLGGSCRHCGEPAPDDYGDFDD